MANIKFKIEGMKELEKSLKKLGKVPQKYVTSAAKKAMTISLKDAKANAPYETGMLKKGIVLKGERSRTKSKKVYRIVFDKAMNDVFEKEYGDGKRGFYPVFQEYGYFTKNGRYIPGFRFISDSLINNVSKIEKTIISTMQKKIDAEIVKVRLK